MQTTTIPTRPQSLDIVKTLAVDAGNRFIKWVDHKGNIQSIPSYTIQLEDCQDTPKPSKNSVILEFEDERWVVGQLAKELGGQPTFEGNKTALAKLLVLSAIAPIGDSDLPLVVENLRLALPDSRHKDDIKNLKELENVRTVIRNGVNFTYSIRKVEAIEEGVGSYRYAMANGLYRFLSRPNGIWDIGGGTSQLKLFTPTGVLMQKSTIILPGTFDLANEIAVALVPRLGYSPSLGLIMDGIADTHYLLGTTGLSFAKEFETARQKWVAGLRTQINNRWRSELATFGEVLIVGGSAPLFQEVEKSTQGRFKIAPDHKFMSVRGMLLDEANTL